MKHYFKVTPGPTYDIVHTHIEKHRAANLAASEWAKSKDLPIKGVRHVSVLFDDGYTPDKKLWRKAKSKGAYVPRTKVLAGRELFEELKALPQFPSWMDLILAFQGKRELDIMMVNSLGVPYAVKHHDEEHYRLMIDSYWLPEDRTGLEEITASQFSA